MIEEKFNLGLFDEFDFPLVVTPGTEGILNASFESIQLLLEEYLPQIGAILFRGFDVGGIEGFEQFCQSHGGDLLTYENGSTPRSKVKGNVYTSTEYPADRSIILHNEMAYTRQWPKKLWFYCMQPAEEGGATPLADSREIYANMPESIRSKAEKNGIRYVRNYRPFVDLSWQRTFNTEDPKIAEQACQEMGIDFQWNGPELKTWQVCQGVTTHPETDVPVWFNQAHLFHSSTMDVKLREALSSMYSEEGMPRNAFYGNGEAIPDSDIRIISRIIDQHTIAFPWKQDDVLVIDNLLIAHGRQPFKGPRKVVVAMNGVLRDTFPLAVK
jgi:alpha-ketoglutarate-dependent taurine dioxygenase